MKDYVIGLFRPSHFVINLVLVYISFTPLHPKNKCE